MTIRRITAPTLIFFGAYGIFAQSTANPPAFVSATIQPSSPYARGISYSAAHNHFVVNNQTLQECIGLAYDLPFGLISGGPAWISSVRYDIVAAPPAPAATGGASPLAVVRDLPMFQTLLTDRFKLQFHREQTLMPVYNLVIGQNGLKIQESTAAPNIGPSLFVQSSPPPVTSTLPARNATMAQVAGLLQRVVVRMPVIDKTGLSARYNFDLQWSPRAAGDKPDILAAIQQLGLALVPAQGLVDTIVIDYAEQPSAN
jgi:uncharacterized protein (TIGR03435 family)